MPSGSLSHYLGEISDTLLGSWYAISLISIFLFFILIMIKSFKNRIDGQAIVSLGVFPTIFVIILNLFRPFFDPTKEFMFAMYIKLQVAFIHIYTDISLIVIISILFSPLFFFKIPKIVQIGLAGLYVLIHVAGMVGRYSLMV